MKRSFVIAIAYLFLLGNAPLMANPGDQSSQFIDIAVVLQHPRCLNCHTNVDHPKQGADRHQHRFRVSRGSEGKGVAGFTCATCHQATNNPMSGVPGAPGWRAAPLSMGWENLTPATLCQTLLDKKKNGGRTAAQIVEHIASDSLVNWGWAPGADREPVPIAKPEYIVLLNKWLETGALCPR